MSCYRVTDWNKHYENAQSRKVRKCSWVAVPNSHDGSGYRRVAAHEHSIELFTAWILILEVASKCEPRGTLRKDGRPINSQDLADKTGFPSSIFELAFQELANDRIGWLTVVDLNSKCISEPESPVATSTLLDASSVLPVHPAVAGQKGTERNGTEGTEGTEKGFVADATVDSDVTKSRPVKRFNPLSLALPFVDTEFRDAWEEWVRYRRERKAALTETGAKRQLKTLKEMGHDRAIRAIQHTIFKGWQGLREPDRDAGPGTGNGRAETRQQVDRRTRREGEYEQPKRDPPIIRIAEGSGGSDSERP